MRYLFFQQLTLQYQAVSFVYHFTLQYHKAAQHAESFFTTSHFSLTKQRSMQCLSLFLYQLQYHKVAQHVESFIYHFTLQYHKVMQHAESFFPTSRFSITK